MQLFIETQSYQTFTVEGQLQTAVITSHKAVKSTFSVIPPLFQLCLTSVFITKPPSQALKKHFTPLENNLTLSRGHDPFISTNKEQLVSYWCTVNDCVDIKSYSMQRTLNTLFNAVFYRMINPLKTCILLDQRTSLC